MELENAIAIIGLSARVPGSSELSEFWSNLCEGNTAFQALSDEDIKAQGIHEKFLSQENYIKVGTGIPDTDKFDAAFFDIPAREACVLDPQQRVFLEGCWEALESAGYATERSNRSVGVFAGASMNSYWMRNLACEPEYVSSNSGFQSLLGNDKDYLATRVAYKLNLHGPAVTLQTACSTSLVAVHMACQNILLGECDMALAGGVSIKVPQEAGYFYQEGMPFSKDGKCLAFDKEGTGTIFGSGMGVVLLKSYEQAVVDNDDILAVVRGSSFNNDGNRKVGFTAPSSEGQVAAIKRALAVAEVDPKTISYIEAHGTGTNLGDPIEFQAIEEVYGQGKLPCRIGALKANIGHLETAAGIVGLIKSVLMLQHKKIPPVANFTSINPHIDIDPTRFSFNTKLEAWHSEGPRRAGVSSFGMGGTNTHIILEEANCDKVCPAESADIHREIITLSAKSSKSLENMTENLAHWLACNPEVSLQHVVATLQERRQDFTFRRAIIAKDVAQALDVMTNQPQKQMTMSSASREDIVFLFPGAGAQYVNMGRDLYRSNQVFRQAIDVCLDRFDALLNHPIRQYLDAPDEQVDALMVDLQKPNLMFPITFTFQYGFAQLFKSWGIHPKGLLGHSHGEYIIAHLAGVMDFDTVTLLVAKRAELMMKLKVGGMLVVPHSYDEVAPLIRGNHISVGAKNSKRNTVLSGEKGQLNSVKDLLETQLNCEVKWLHIDAGLHSYLVDEIYDEFYQVVDSCKLHTPQLDWVSSISGDWVSASEVTAAKYWAEHMRNTVEYAKASATLVEKFGNAVFVDLGPNQVVGELLRENHAEKNLAIVSVARSVRQKESDYDILRDALSKVWLFGYPLDWQAMGTTTQQLMPLPLPTYAFDRKTYWIEPKADSKEGADFENMTFISGVDEQESDVNTLGNRPNLMTPYTAPATATEESITDIWQKFFGINPIGSFDNFIELGGTSLLATEVIGEINKSHKCKVTLSDFLAGGNIKLVAALVSQWHAKNEEQLKLEILKELEQELAN
ncbi:type I polyketide synthase [Pseudoalteromonas sp. MMG005]|uniref:type I polyketide synthase n=1 Tax=Pseudoalteromonas sp. MMG005 TaxID=2822682 RepID=UPI001B39FCF3|nr:type I polyketide synthase [Pseudoalteromonas sp. MMG005]MBQ4844014.1 acyltransferase domain-containing protein [Pseudoalteromonas sp. MMG005]